MTHDEMITAIEAHKRDGKVLFRQIGVSTDSYWHEVRNPGWDFSTNDYRPVSKSVHVSSTFIFKLLAYSTNYNKGYSSSIPMEIPAKDMPTAVEHAKSILGSAGAMRHWEFKLLSIKWWGE